MVRNPSVPTPLAPFMARAIRKDRANQRVEQHALVQVFNLLSVTTNRAALQLPPVGWVPETRLLPLLVLPPLCFHPMSLVRVPTTTTFLASI